jgi:hypothetical protein
MTLDQFPFRELTTPAGIVAAGILIRQLIEVAKKDLVPWLDARNERKGTFIIAALLYLAWLLVYGTDLERDGIAAFAAFWATATGAIGVNESVDAAKGVVAKNVGGNLPNADLQDSGPGGGPLDDSADRSVPIEHGPDLDLLVDEGDVEAFEEEPPRDPALDPNG